MTDGFVTLSDGRQERKVIVKLTDFGLSTTDIESSDMDCGSAPYMSYGQSLIIHKLCPRPQFLPQNAGTTWHQLIVLALLMSGHSASYSLTCEALFYFGHRL